MSFLREPVSSDKSVMYAGGKVLVSSEGTQLRGQVRTVVDLGDVTVTLAEEVINHKTSLKDLTVLRKNGNNPPVLGVANFDTVDTEDGPIVLMYTTKEAGYADVAWSPDPDFRFRLAASLLPESDLAQRGYPGLPEPVKFFLNKSIGRKIFQISGVETS